MFKNKLGLNQKDIEIRRNFSVASVSMVMLLTIISVSLSAMLLGVISTEEFCRFFSLSESQVAIVNLVFSRMRELTNGIVAVLTKVFDYSKVGS